MVSNFDDLIKVSHEMAVEKGWWPEDKKRLTTEIFNNFHSEISEAWEEYRRGRMFPWYEQVPGDISTLAAYAYERLGDFPAGPKPEGFGVELADFLIRLADWCGSLGIEKLDKRDEEIVPDYKIKSDEMIMFLHITTCELFDLAEAFSGGDKIIDGLLLIFGEEVSEKSKAAIEKKKQAAISMDVSRAVHCCLNQVESFMGNDNLWKVVNLKLSYNASRSFRHGGMKA